MTRSPLPSALTVAGSDSGGGAGIQADLKTFQAFGVHGLSAITALTAQNTRAVTAVHAVPPAMIEAQLDALFDDFSIGAAKTGMLGDARTIRAVVRALSRRHLPALVVDPVMIATSGAALLDPRAVDAMRDLLLPRAALVTPNIPEAQALTGRTIRRAADCDRVAADLLDAGAQAVLIKGGHRAGRTVVDRLYAGGREFAFEHPRLPRRGHGTGCTLAAAITAGLVLKRDLVAACDAATRYVHTALNGAYRPGRSKIDVLDHAVKPPAGFLRRAPGDD
ncbi:bifunctional hydroxymethylpyrimidine kinase/phosphomethylpyrimidine kinase [Tahibacter soli]|jgi:hydroxymethylpyrimidine/phosphomethylpyrimidine kinase|uniref:hydroxymethylpyrimidine kinase n=1 Tax=Tahibacter soli TaxID=2983605 RepID=A0A9X4BI17_9GAMM|nr:bifunctional hydroxymethylpyrimidine kinase/phosphomethylpyrimidine kinase [Tahibacter soli]MDC8011772.1 bifunctional hydroxymethylpyrimidine kinase/phosphomethylpyrimidine kinase [Tahibacter soli]